MERHLPHLGSLGVEELGSIYGRSSPRALGIDAAGESDRDREFTCELIDLGRASARPRDRAATFAGVRVE
jgi:hypothetical protein